MKIAIVSSDQSKRAQFFGGVNIPCNYMEDFTLMGFTVDKFEEALTLLSSSGYIIEEGIAGAFLHIENKKDVVSIFEVLRENAILGEYTDIADTFYQA